MERIVANFTDEQLLQLRRGGHDSVKVHSAYARAVQRTGRPTVILCHTVKGWSLGEGFEASNVTHQMKKLSFDQLKVFRDRLDLPIKNADLEEAPPFYHPGENSAELEYMKQRRVELGGPVPTRKVQVAVDLELPKNDTYAKFYEGTPGNRSVSTTMAFVAILTKLLDDKNIGKRIVPIVPDEARTFGMDSLFRKVGIYAAKGQLYEPIDRNVMLYYREAKDGQLLEEGITEAGSMASFTAAGTAYAAHGQPMIPFYIFYSMFGFQRIGDLVWSFGDQRGRGFLLGATAGRTTLNGEGLQHEDGHSHILAATVPNVLAYDPAFAYEIAVIIEDGMRRMYDEDEDVFYYITLQNENYAMPPMPKGKGVKEGILRGLYLFDKATAKAKKKHHVQLFGSDTIMNQVLAARDLLAEKYGVSADVWSATSYQQLRNDALAARTMEPSEPGTQAAGFTRRKGAP